MTGLQYRQPLVVWTYFQIEAVWWAIQHIPTALILSS